MPRRSEPQKVFLQFPQMVYLWPADLSEAPAKVYRIVYDEAELEAHLRAGWQTRPHTQKHNEEK